MLAIVISTLTIVTQMALSHIIRTKLSEKMTNELLKKLALELIATAELCGTCFELVIIADNYGVSLYALYLFGMTIWWGKSWGEATACPYSLLEDYVENGGSPREIVMKIVAQVIGAIASFRWVKTLWLMEFSVTHVGRAVDTCTADLAVPAVYGFLIEFTLTCLCRLVSRALGELEPKYASSIDSFFSTSMVVLAFDTSGGYFNPVLATGLKFGCKGHTNFEHFLVYWAGSSLGALASIKIWETPQSRKVLVEPFMAKTDVEKKEQ